MTFESTDTPPGYSDSLADQNFITFRDPTGEQAIANLSGDVTIQWRNGFTIRVPADNTRGLITWLNSFSFTKSRRGLLTAAKKKGPALTGPNAPTNSHESKDNI